MAKKNSSGGVVIIGLVIAALFIKFWQPLVTIGIVVLIIWAVVRLGKKRETASQPQSKQISSSHLSPSHAIRTGQVFEPQNQSTSFKPRTTIQFPDDIWVPSGKTIQHAGYLIPGGLIYFGRGLHSVSNRQEEPALINPKLPVDNTRPDREGRNISYWPSYSEIPPSSRAAYLEWLSNGKKDPNINIGYVFLYFYGLERRALADTKKSASARNEITTIIAEAKRLLSIYGGNGSFRGYVGTFSDALEASSLQATHLYLTTPKIQPLSWETPLTLKVALGQIARDGVQLPAEWALAWAGNDPSMPQRTPTQRCPEEFRELFRLRYSEKFGEGFKLKINKTPIQTTYRPASSSFGGAIEISSPLPDLTKITGPSAKIRDLATACIDELEGYSRYLGRNPDGKNSIEAISYLPKPLLKGHGGADFKKMSEWLDKILSTETLAPVHFSSVLQQCPSINQTTFGKKEATAIANLLGKMNIGIEPDPRFGSIVPKPEQDVILFRISDNAPSSPSAEYSAATVVLHLASAVAGADGTIHQTEERHLEEHLEEWLHLAADERTRLKAHTQWLLSSFPSLSGVKKRMELLRQDQKESLGRFLVGVAQADGYIDPSEIKTLTKIYEMLGLDTQSLYSHAHAAAATPVTVQTADFVKSQGYAIPVPPTKPAKGISLDFGSIETKLAETVAVSAILNSIFTGDEQAQPTAPAPDPTVSDVPIAGMDLESFSFMQVLASKLIWVRGELEKLAADHNLMLDGTLDSINDASFDHFGGPFFEGDDPIEINPEFAKEIAA